MKRLMFVLTIFALLLVACAPTPETQTHIALATATIERTTELPRATFTVEPPATNAPPATDTLDPTATLTKTKIPTATLTASFTPSASPRPSATATRVPPTNTPKPTAIPEIIVTEDKKLVNEKGEVLRGSVIIQFEYDYKNVSERLDQARSALKYIRQRGANSVIFTVNAALFDNQRLLSDLSSALKEAQGMGLSTILSLHSNGGDFEGVNTYTTARGYTTVDSSLKEKWLKLLSNKEYGPDIIKATNAYILIQEAGPVFDSNNNLVVRDFDWKSDIQYYLETTQAIRNLTGQDTPISFAGGWWARRYSDLLDLDNAPMANLLLNISPYYENDQHTKGDEALYQVPALRLKGWTPLVSEFGYKYAPKNDTADEIKKRVDYARANNIAYFMWRIEDDPILETIFSSR